MDSDSMVARNARNMTEKLFGDKDPQMKQIVYMQLALDPDDSEDMEYKQKVLNKIRKENTKDFEFLKEKGTFLVYDAEGNLVPYKVS